jgi:hypothetical protein
LKVECKAHKHLPKEIEMRVESNQDLKEEGKQGCNLEPERWDRDCFKGKKEGQAWWLTCVIPGTQEDLGSRFKGRWDKKLWRPYLNKQA